MKSIIRFFLFPFAVVTGGEWYAEEGTLKYKFLKWLYGAPIDQYVVYLEPDDDE